MKRETICDIMYGQNWVDQAIQWRKLYRYNTIDTTCCYDVVDLLDCMARCDHATTYRMRGRDFRTLGQCYVMVR